MDLTIQATVTTLLTFTAMSYFGRAHKLLELTSHFRVQYSFAALALLPFALLRGDLGSATAAAIALGVNLSTIVAFYRRQRHEPGLATNRTKVKIVLINVHHGNPHHAQCLAFLNRESPNVIVAQEINDEWAYALGSLRTKYSFFDVLPREHGSGIAIYSQFQYSLFEISPPESEIRPSILVKLHVGESRISMLALHPRAPIRPGHFEKRNALLTWAGAQIRQLEPPKICIGDLNCSPWSPYYRDLLRTSDLRDTRRGFGLLPSWPTFLGLKAFMIPIDHCLISPDVHPISVRTGERIGSDHFPLIVELASPSSGLTLHPKHGEG